ncbi:thiopurine S-methyltransferase [Alkalimonas collagenimarina]|uniref:Thiopurine S-methyltransferase n=1 Tax=Alkalimonas collagenimarina TaxID=400390 RepID=A0ABT9H321_9GAMM|nr:thiopurine S-methyltransferase [Alkalimonas collagenimarina]MDP4537719.1 thiopurine S-methyltransferase [Alkalimonas collagenimarina]
MQHAFWLECWQQPYPGFHLDQVHPLLQSCWSRVYQPELHSQVLVPLCGKSMDMIFLRQHIPVVGVELAERACADFFQEQQLPLSLHKTAHYQVYTTERLRLLQGDFFQLTKDNCTECCLAYDRAALIALPVEMRQRYVKHLRRVLPEGSTLLVISLEYPPEEKQGPPFAVFEAEIRQLFAGAQIDLLAISNRTGLGFARRAFATSSLIEKAWRIQLP